MVGSVYKVATACFPKSLQGRRLRSDQGIGMLEGAYFQCRTFGLSVTSPGGPNSVLTET
jgi:hypothetical protein